MRPMNDTPDESTPCEFLHANGGGNGASKPTSNGTDATAIAVPAPYQSKYRSDELTRLLMQQMRLMGYHGAAKTLEAECGYTLEHPLVGEFRNHMLAGRWDHAELLLSNLMAQSTISDRNDALFLIRQQKYLECLETQSIKQAMLVLQQELTTLNVNKDRLHQLTMYLMLPSRSELHHAANWLGAGVLSRQTLLERVQGYFPPSMIVPNRRLEKLLDQAVSLQRVNCLYHLEDTAPSLFVDHQCDPSQFPRKVTKVLRGHDDEVWLLTFSHNGAFLASGSKDSSIIIWDVENGVMLHELKGHRMAIASLAWSPDDMYLLSGSHDHDVRLWHVAAGTCQEVMNLHTQPTTACAWFPDSERFLTAGQDCCIYTWNIQGTRLSMINAPRVHDMALDAEHNLLYVGCNEDKLYVYNVDTGAELYTIDLLAQVTSLTLLPNDSNLLLVSLMKRGMQLWDMEHRQVVQSYKRQFQGRYILRPTLAGADSLYIACGDQDGGVYIWNRFTGQLKERLVGHRRTVNVVTWNPVNGRMFATASDDQTIRLWGPAKRDSAAGGPSSRSHETLDPNSSQESQTGEGARPRDDDDVEDRGEGAPHSTEDDDDDDDDDDGNEDDPEDEEAIVSEDESSEGYSDDEFGGPASDLLRRMGVSGRLTL